MWIPIVLVLALAVGVLLILLGHGRARERKLNAELGQSRAQAAEADARVAAIKAVEQRYQGIMDLEAAMTALEVQRNRGRKYFAEFGIYNTRYDFQTSERYREALDAIRQRQKDAIEAGTAAVCHVPWTVEGSVAKGRKMTKDSFKNEYANKEEEERQRSAVAAVGA